jgi:hypothetical protein
LPWWPALLRRVRPDGIGHLRDSWPRNGSIAFFLLAWFFIPFLVFCLVQSRLPLYLLPLFLPLSLMLALALRERIDVGSPYQRIALALWLIFLLGLKAGVAYFMHPSTDNRVIAQQLKGAADLTSYHSIIFVHNTQLDYTIEEETPWGLRMYMEKPIYGIKWLSPKGEEALCHALRASGSSLVVVDPNLTPDSIQPALTRCSARGTRSVGMWHDRALEIVQI